MLYRYSFICFFVSCFLLTEVASAQDDAEKPIIIDPANVDVDYGFQGEYFGYISGGFRRKTVGLQVVAQGSGSFLVVEHVGGLPGSGFDGENRIVHEGNRVGDAVEFSTDIYDGIISTTEIKIYEGTILRGVLLKKARTSPTLELSAPEESIVIFDGTSLDAFDMQAKQKARMTAEGLLEQGAFTKEKVTSFYLHGEFRTPYMPAHRGQARGNSGFYLQTRYEVQVLDSFGLEGAFNETGALYRQQPPLVNMCLPPLTWQTYDIFFTHPEFDENGKKTKNARISVFLNGVVVQDDLEVVSKTGAGSQEGPNPLPFRFQNHKDPVRFRNIWVVKGDPAEQLANFREHHEYYYVPPRSADVSMLFKPMYPKPQIFLPVTAPAATSQGRGRRR